jgi:acyl-CoA thioester hydrolase
MSEKRPQPMTRADFRVFRPIQTRWEDNDVYGHVNNVVYYAWFDTAVNSWLIENGALDIHGGLVIGLVVHTQCHYFSPLAFPQPVEIGIRLAQSGRSSVRYQLGVFAKDAPLTAAWGEFTHVYVDAQTHRPTPIPTHLLELLEHIR